jgi:Ca2+-binding EF-hand superfamily protein
VLELQDEQEMAVREAVRSRNSSLARERASIKKELEGLKMRNEVLTEMVAAEQVNAKLHGRRCEALKWELLRLGQSEEAVNGLGSSSPVRRGSLSSTLKGTGTVTGVYDMSAAMERMTDMTRGNEGAMMDAFRGRDKGGTGRLGASDFKDALREALPDLPREDRNLVALRFMDQGDETVAYEGVVETFRKKSARKRLKGGISAVMAAQKFTTTSSPKRGSSVALPTPPTPQQRQAQEFRRASQQTPSANIDEVIEKLFPVIRPRLRNLEDMLRKFDPSGSGLVPTVDFSRCLRELKDLQLHRSERKALYENFAKDGMVVYGDFLRAFQGAVPDPLVLSRRKSLSTSAAPSPIPLPNPGGAAQAFGDLALAYQQFGADALRLSFEEYDPNDYRSVSLDEFVSIMAQVSPESSREDVRALFFIRGGSSGGLDLDYDALLDDVREKAEASQFRRSSSSSNRTFEAGFQGSPTAGTPRRKSSLRRSGSTSSRPGPAPYRVGDTVQVRQQQSIGGDDVWEAARIVSVGRLGHYTVRYRNNGDEESDVPEKDLRELLRSRPSRVEGAGERVPERRRSMGQAMAAFLCCQQDQGMVYDAQAAAEAERERRRRNRPRTSSVRFGDTTDFALGPIPQKTISSPVHSHRYSDGDCSTAASEAFHDTRHSSLTSTMEMSHRYSPPVQMAPRPRPQDQAERTIPIRRGSRSASPPRRGSQEVTVNSPIQGIQKNRARDEAAIRGRRMSITSDTPRTERSLSASSSIYRRGSVGSSFSPNRTSPVRRGSNNSISPNRTSPVRRGSLFSESPPHLRGEVADDVSSPLPVAAARRQSRSNSPAGNLRDMEQSRLEKRGSTLYKDRSVSPPGADRQRRNSMPKPFDAQ